MMEQVNLSRLSHGVRASAASDLALLNEALVCARTRMVAFGKTIIEYPCSAVSFLKIATPAEQSLSMFLFAANTMDRANAGSKQAGRACCGSLTPLLKFRACRDNIPVATGAMEVRGGNGYIEEWVHARLVRDAHIGVLWEGTSNINALDIVTRAVGKSRAHRTLETALTKLLDEATPIPAAFRDRLRLALDRTLVFAERVAAEPALEATARQAASALYHVTSAILMTWEAAQPGADARRALYARFVLEHRLSAQDPLEPDAGDWERDAAELVFFGQQSFAPGDRSIAWELTSAGCGCGTTGYSAIIQPKGFARRGPRDDFRTGCAGLQARRRDRGARGVGRGHAHPGARGDRGAGRGIGQDPRAYRCL